MTENKDLKRLVRARMRKTGEAYTTARAQIAGAAKPASPRKSRTKDLKNFGELAGMSDVAVKEKTGREWREWVKALDADRAAEMSHRDIAALLRSQHQLGSWWGQMVAVGYERIKGLRDRAQQRNGTYEITKSRTYGVPVAMLFQAWADAKVRRRWLDFPGVKVRTATAPKSIRLDWEDGAIIAAGFVSKSGMKSSVALAHTKVKDREAAERLKKFWTERLAALGEVLAK